MFIILACIAFVIPIAGFFLTLLYFHQSRNSLHSAILCGLSFSAAMYGYVADSGSDISRHMENLLIYRDLPIYDCFDVLQEFHVSHVYTWDIWSWIVSQTDNPYLLQSTAAFIGYCILSYIIFDYAVINHLRMKYWLFVFFILLATIPPLDVSVGIRSANAFIICTFAFYQYYLKKSSCLFAVSLLVIAFFLHHCIVVVVVSWLILPLFSKHKWICTLFIIIFMTLFNNYNLYLSVLSNQVGIFSELSTNVMYSAVNYQISDVNQSIHAVVSFVWRLVFTILVLYCARCVANQKHIQSGKCWEREFVNLAIIILIFSICLIFIIGNNGSRYFEMSSLLGILVLLNGENAFSVGKDGVYKIYRMALVIGASGNLCLYLYDMSWGTASLQSFLLSSILGYISRFIINLS